MYFHLIFQPFLNHLLFLFILRIYTLNTETTNDIPTDIEKGLNFFSYLRKLFKCCFNATTFPAHKFIQAVDILHNQPSALQSFFYRIVKLYIVIHGYYLSPYCFAQMCVACMCKRNRLKLNVFLSKMQLSLI